MSMKISETWLDKKWQETIRLLFGHKCAVCGRQGTEAHHIVYRRNRAFRWHPLNGVLLCKEHHIPFAHEQRKWFTEWLKHNLPAQYKYCIDEFNENNITITRDGSKNLLIEVEYILTKDVIGRKQ